MTGTDLAILAGFALAAFIVFIVWANITYSRSTEEEKKETQDEMHLW